MKNITVGELRKAIDGVPDELELRLTSDSGVDQGECSIIIENAQRRKYENVDYFEIYANYREEE